MLLSKVSRDGYERRKHEVTEAAGGDGVTLALDGSVAVITFDRPEKANALRLADYERYLELVKHCEQDPQVRVVIVTGAGDKYFTVGDDYTDYDSEHMAEFRARNAYERMAHLDPVSAAGRILWNSPKISIAAVNGACMMPDILWWSDLRIMADTATLNEHQVGLGVAPSCGGTQLLPRLAGRAKALEVLLLGAPLTAQEALRHGVVNAVVPLAELMPTARQWAERIVASPEAAVAMTKLSVNASQDLPLEWGARLERFGSYVSELTSDIWERTAEFVKAKGGSG
jgi:enoyl-CoA hydratase/carnithine racemase